MKDFEELLALFRDRGVKALVVGGYAVAFHARPRFTQDIDLWIEPSDANARRVMASLEEFGFGSVGLAVNDFANLDQIVQLGFPPNRVDLLTSIDGVEFADAWAGRQKGPFGALPEVDYLGRADLIRNKRASGRPQDLLDLASLEDPPE
jgi:hypothetical protein